MSEQIQIRIHGDAALPVLVYLPGLHGDWTLAAGFREAIRGRVRFIELTYPRSLTWSLAEYADGVEQTLARQGVSHGWLLAESFGSLVAWEILGSATAPSPAGAGTPAARFDVLGLVLAGGFVRHPMPWGARLLRLLGAKMPQRVYRLLILTYAGFLQTRNRSAPMVAASLVEFVERRTELDRAAMRARLELVAEADPRPTAEQTTVPVYHLGPLMDPIVPSFGVRRWLRHHCPGYRGSKTCWLGDHTVLASAPQPAAETVRRWMATESSRLVHGPGPIPTS